jgi:hypothetical protein
LDNAEPKLFREEKLQHAGGSIDQGLMAHRVAQGECAAR